MSAIARRASANGGVRVEPLKSLSVRQQTQFKLANKISGVTWPRIRAFLGGRDSRFASLSALRADQVSFSLEAQNQVKTCDEGVYFVSPRAAIQALIDYLVERKEFLECPLGPGLTSASEDRRQPVQSPLAAATEGGGEPTGDATSGGLGAGGICGSAAGGGERLVGPAFRHVGGARCGTTVAVGGFRGWKGRGPSAVDSTPPGRGPKISRSGPARE